MRRLLALSVGTLLLGAPVTACASAAPRAAPGRAARDLPEDEARALHPLAETYDSLRRDAGSAMQSPERLLALLQLAGRAHLQTAWRLDYHHLRAARDTRDEASARREDSLAVAEDQVFERVGSAIAALADSTFERLMSQSPELAAYRTYVAEARRTSRHRPPPQVAELQAAATAWPFALYQRLVDRTEFGTVPTAHGALDVRRQRAAIAADPDSAVRESGYQKLAAGYARERDLYAVVLIGTVRSQNAMARAFGEPDAPTRVYGSRQLAPAEVRALIAAVRSRGALFQRYEAAVARMRAALGGRPAPRLSLAQTRDALRSALSDLGSEYAGELTTLLDPAQGRLDLGPGEHRRSGGFSFVLPSGEHGVYLDSFSGLPAEVSRLVHESGHALHRESFEHGTAPTVCHPAFSEAVAQFGEVLVAERLARMAGVPADALQWRQQELLKLLEVFLGAKDAELEQAIYDGVAGGAVNTADDLDSLTARVDSAYTRDRRPGSSGRWMRTGLLFEDPLYLSNYLYSGSIILALVQQHAADPAVFAPRYRAFLYSAAEEPPHAMLRRTVGLNLDSPDFLRDGFALLEDRIAAFEREIAHVEAGPR